MEDIWEAWKDRAFAAVYRLSAALAGVSTGVIKHNLSVIDGELPTTREWLQVWARRAACVHTSAIGLTCYSCGRSGLGS